MFNEDEVEAGRGALVSLHRALPVPDQDVPLDDILKFKEKRRPELLALRATLDDAYLAVANSADPQFALQSKTAQVEQACDDYMRSAKGFGLSFRMMNLDASVNLVALAASSLAAKAANLDWQNAVGSIAASTIAVNVGHALKNKAASDRPYHYVARYHDELFTL